jgi:hypothetical protein
MLVMRIGVFTFAHYHKRKAVSDMPRCLLARECAVTISEELNMPLRDVVDVLVKIPIADVVPKSELEHILSDLKKQIHDRAVYPETRSVKPYISLKVVDAIINNKMEEFRNEK